MDWTANDWTHVYALVAGGCLAVVMWVIKVIDDRRTARKYEATRSKPEPLNQMQGQTAEEAASNRDAWLRSRQRAEDYRHLVWINAHFRYSIRLRGARELLAERGFAPTDVIQTNHDESPGGDYITLVLSDGRTIEADFREDRVTRQNVSVTNWEVLVHAPHDMPNSFDLAAEIFRDPYLKDAFDRAVLAYFDFHLRRDDRPLPPR